MTSDKELQALSNHLQAIFKKDKRLPFTLTEKLLDNVQAGACSGWPNAKSWLALPVNG